MVTATAGGQESGPNTETGATPQVMLTATGALNDTGITWSGARFSGNAETCDPAHPAGQDCHYGRDAQAVAGTPSKVGDGNAGFDFIRIENNGFVLPTSASGPNIWVCTRDNVTGLIWEVKVNNSAHLRHKGHNAHLSDYPWHVSFADQGLVWAGHCHLRSSGVLTRPKAGGDAPLSGVRFAACWSHTPARQKTGGDAKSLKLDKKMAGEPLGI